MSFFILTGSHSEPIRAVPVVGFRCIYQLDYSSECIYYASELYQSVLSRRTATDFYLGPLLISISQLGLDNICN
ncbi:hypothetical protein QE152_g1399 [Popillia japonica]|uniref:Uncharacterized protein n=1 Tax=Popillia japonica TaxID=7064 RepID=A0AAW1N2Q4_POPJA